MSISTSLSSVVLLAGLARAVDLPACTLSFDGRVPQNATAQTFVSKQSPFNPGYVLGPNVTWDQVIEFPQIPPSRFDIQANTKPVGLSLSDKSVFLSGSEGLETALRRTELLVNNNNPTVSGHKTWHVSVRTDPSRPLNYTHEYIFAFHEAQDYQADFWSIKAGAELGAPVDTPPRKTLRVEGYKWDVPTKRFFETPLTDDVWHNFGINLDFDQNLISVLYSTGDLPLEVVMPPTFNNISGKAPTTLGETHFGLQKRPLGANIENFLFNGTQEEGIDEALFLGGIFQDDSTSGCVTL
ncbi:hypothetical protein PG996_009869 [Apiospora saccharicola]|uniref:Glycoside hydrolase 131 catalytic N-terminal domain-containing protein n=1 Tax=Apiospora saccharicola TaxID=335842 RepID=A0ABR1UM13_9PEZI